MTYDPLVQVRQELNQAYAKHGREPWGRHEFYGILKEEVDELWDDIKSDAPIDNVLREALQVAAMCARYLETGDRYWGAHPTFEVLPSVKPGGAHGVIS
jgi:hypothetical protein